MRKRILFITILIVASTGVFYFVSGQHRHRQNIEPLLKDGDIAFQTLSGDLGNAIQHATHSKYDHCGILYYEDSAWYVYEAIGPVTRTPIAEWIDRGEGAHYVIKRLKDSSKLTQQIVSQMKRAGSEFSGKGYDGYFGWSDDKIYCSELVWKIYKRGANIEVGKLQKLKEFDLTSKAVRKELAERYGSNIPMDDTVISPVAIYNADVLKTVTEN